MTLIIFFCLAIKEEEGILIYAKERGNFSIPPSSGNEGSNFEPLIPFLSVIMELKIA
jgi:hypothetical protein